MAKSSRALALSNRTSNSTSPKLIAAKKQREPVAERERPESARKSVSIATLAAKDAFNNLTESQRACERLQSLLSPRCRLNGAEEIHIEPIELLNLVAVLDADLERQLRALRAAIEGTREEIG